MGNRDKDKENSDAGTMGEGAESACEACQATWDLSHERVATIDKLVAEAISRESVQLTDFHWQSEPEQCSKHVNQP